MEARAVVSANALTGRESWGIMELEAGGGSPTHSQATTDAFNYTKSTTHYLVLPATDGPPILLSLAKLPTTTSHSYATLHSYPAPRV
jgi:hypothetical protein